MLRNRESQHQQQNRQKTTAQENKGKNQARNESRTETRPATRERTAIFHKSAGRCSKLNSRKQTHTITDEETTRESTNDGDYRTYLLVTALSEARYSKPAGQNIGREAIAYPKTSLHDEMKDKIFDINVNVRDNA
jgi:hypothetical protein